MSHKYFLINKPFGMLSQFSKEGGHATLGDLQFTFPKNVYPVGRLDKDSEGLLLLTNDNKLKTQFLNPESRKSKTYWVQVEGTITPEAIEQLKKGVIIKHNKKKYTTRKCEVQKIASPELWERVPPIRERKNIPTSWIEIVLYEGKNRQIRKMTAAVGFPTLRLVRVGVGHIDLSFLKSQTVVELDLKSAYLALAK